MTKFIFASFIKAADSNKLRDWLVVAANLIAWPIAYWIMSRWLENYIYRSTAHPAFFLIAGVASVLLAQFVVSYHTLRAASRNPVDALRYE